MKQIFLFVAIFSATSSLAQTNWEKISLTEKVSISFPAKPVSSSAKGQKTFILKQADSTANYVAATSDLEVLMGVDAATLQTEMEKEESWDQAKVGFVNSMGVGAKLVKDEMVMIKNTRSLKLYIEKTYDSGGTNLITVLIFVNGTNTINIIFNNRGGKADLKNEQQFLNSIEIEE